MTSKTSRSNAGSTTSAMRAVSASATMTASASITCRSAGRKRGDARVEGRPQPVAAAVRAARPSARGPSRPRSSARRGGAGGGGGDELERERQAVDERAQAVGRERFGRLPLEKREFTSRARSTSRVNASRVASGPTGISASSRTPRRSRLVTSTRIPGTGRQHPANLRWRPRHGGAHSHRGRAGRSRHGAARPCRRDASGAREDGATTSRTAAATALGRRQLLEGDVPHGPSTAPGRLERQARLPGARRPDEGDEARACSTPPRGPVAPAARPIEPGRGARHSRPRRFALGGRARTAASRAGSCASTACCMRRSAGPGSTPSSSMSRRRACGVHVERLRLAARAVEREHQQLPATLAVGLLGDELPCRARRAPSGRLDDRAGAEEELARPSISSSRRVASISASGT